MIKRESVVSALEHRETNPVPYTISLTIQESENISSFLGGKKYAQDFGTYIHSYDYFESDEIANKPGYFKDKFGVIWNRSGLDKDIGIIESPLIPDVDNHNYIFPKIDKEHVYNTGKKFLQQRGDKFAMLGIGFSLFERLWTLCGMENALMSMVGSPNAIHKLLDGICEYNLQFLDILLELDVDGIYFGDDWGDQRGVMMGPAHWREFLKPRLAKMYEKVHSKGKFVLQHSCGNIGDILGDLIDIGLDAYQTVQPEIYNLEQIKREFGADLTFWGTISTQRLLPQGTPDEVRSETIRIMNIMKKGGGYIASPTHAVPHDVPAENIAAMLDVFMNQDKYL